MTCAAPSCLSPLRFLHEEDGTATERAERALLAKRPLRFLYEEDGDAGKASKASAGDATPRGGGGGGDAFQGAANGPNGQLQHGGSLSFHDLESGGGGGEGGAAAASGRVSGFGSGAAAESTGAAPGQTVAVQRNMSGRRSLGSAAVELSVRTGAGFFRTCIVLECGPVFAWSCLRCELCDLAVLSCRGRELAAVLGPPGHGCGFGGGDGQRVDRGAGG